MEPIMGALSEGECSYLSGMFSTEDADFMAQLLGNHPFPSKQGGGPNMGILPSFWPGHEASIMSTELGNDGSPFRLDIVNSDPYSFSQGSSYDSYSNGNSSLIFPTSGHVNYYLSDSNQTFGTSSSSMSMDIFMRDEKITASSVQVFPENLMEEAVCLHEEMISNNLVKSGGDPPVEKQMQLKRKPEMLAMVSASDDGNNDNLPENPKKKLRAAEVKRINKKNLQSKKNQNHVSSSTHEDESNSELNRHSSSNYCSSEDDSNASQELNGGTASTSKGSTALNSIGKTRASRGSATDPQSLYARKRRERINERLKILQSLVPNGTKVDISTMLEEAVQYVKFLQLQIKLLSSEDLWMYAPLPTMEWTLGSI